MSMDTRFKADSPLPTCSGCFNSSRIVQTKFRKRSVRYTLTQILSDADLDCRKTY